MLIRLKKEKRGSEEALASAITEKTPDHYRSAKEEFVASLKGKKILKFP